MLAMLPAGKVQVVLLFCRWLTFGARGRLICDQKISGLTPSGRPSEEKQTISTKERAYLAKKKPGTKVPGSEQGFGNPCGETNDLLD
ncbi:MAG: hypothetical protein AAAC47_31105 [Pararhizobium sp.]